MRKPSFSLILRQITPTLLQLLDFLNLNLGLPYNLCKKPSNKFLRSPSFYGFLSTATKINNYQESTRPHERWNKLDFWVQFSFGVKWVIVETKKLLKSSIDLKVEK